ncbi:MAG: SCP2 sterol-binding domain-containing protein [Candidatus Thermoplasmatota archaeon]|nr:SCP2 sterol-binding domain-containing protein [Candidatus Thermoplasmatota archaeon]
MAKFFTEQYFQDLAARLNADTEWRKKAEGITSRIVTTVSDRGISALLDIQNGEVKASQVDADTPADFKFEADYDVWKASAQGEGDLTTLVMTGRMRFRGSMSKIMAMMTPLNRLTEILRDLPKDFD